MPISTMSYLPRSSRERIEAADIKETSCSPERPPNITPTRTLGMLRSNCRLSPFANQFNFGFERHTELLVHGRTSQVHQRLDIRRLSLTGVDEEVGVHGRNLRLPDPPALQPRRFDEPAGIIAGGVLEHRA